MKTRGAMFQERRFANPQCGRNSNVTFFANVREAECPCSQQRFENAKNVDVGPFLRRHPLPFGGNHGSTKHGLIAASHMQNAIVDSCCVLRMVVCMVKRIRWKK